MPKSLYLPSSSFLDEHENLKFIWELNSFMWELNYLIDLLPKSMDWFLYDRDIHHWRVNDTVFFLKMFFSQLVWQNKIISSFRSSLNYGIEGAEQLSMLGDENNDCVIFPIIITANNFPLICSKSTAKTLKKGEWNMFKVNIKNSRMTSLTYFTPFSNVSIFDFEQVNVSWVNIF